MKNKDDCLWFGNMCFLYGYCRCLDCEAYFPENLAAGFTDDQYQEQFKKSYEKGLKNEPEKSKK